MVENLFPIVSDASEPIGKALGSTLAEVWQGIVGDRVVAWRLNNAAKINERLRTELASKGVQLRQDALPEAIAFKWFEEATQADEPEIQELFARLLANAATGNEDALRKRNIELVSSLSPEDARFLAFIADRFVAYLARSTAQSSAFALSLDWAFNRAYTDAGFRTSLPIDSLVSLGVLRHVQNFNSNQEQLEAVIGLMASDYVRGTSVALPNLFEVEESLILTEVGRSLLLALSRDGVPFAARKA